MPASALECIQEATRIAEVSLDPEKVPDRANLAALYDALSRRQSNLLQMEDGLASQ